MISPSFIDNPEYLKYKSIFDECIEFIGAEIAIYEGENVRVAFSGGGKTTPGIRDSIYYFLKTPIEERLAKYRTNSVHLYVAKKFGNSLAIQSILNNVKNNPNQKASIKLSVEGSVRNRFYFNEEKRVAFLDIPKCASSSFRENSMFRDRILSQSEIDYGNLTTVAIIRNPVDRIVSGFLETVKRRSLPQIYRYYNQPVFDDIFSQPTIEFSFEKMIDLLISGELKDSHVISQSEILNNSIEGGKLRINYFYKFENIQSSIDSFMGLGFYVTMKNLNQIQDIESKRKLHHYLLKNHNLTEKLRIYLEADFRLYDLAK